MSAVLFITVIVLVVLLCKGCTKHSNERQVYVNNIEALTDTISLYKCRNGELVSEKLLLIGDNKLLEQTNKQLAVELKNMKVKNSKLAASLSLKVDNIQHDTCWLVIPDTTNVNNFNFDELPFRRLSGTVAYDSHNIQMRIDTDIVYAKLDLAVEDNTIKVHSDNPYLEFTDIYGITVPDYEPSWCLVIGPSIGVGYGPLSPYRVDANVGISLTFGWNIRGVGKRVRR